ncbi:MAG: helicase C-terminal domain-containing protein [Opitutaceae bacterium]|nr:helicase C-terminal domain-containing protein [Opitutaceae bacterium]
MIFDLAQHTSALSVGEFAGFALGPQDSSGGGGGIWRAQLGTHWHNELRLRATAEHATAAEFEIPITGRIAHRGWTLTLTGRIDQVIRAPDGITLREIKSVTRALPADESELRRDYPDYFVQLATYATLRRNGLLAVESQSADILRGLSGGAAVRAELVFVEVGSGLAQTIVLTPADDALFRAQLERITQFLTLRLRARQRLQNLRFRPAFAVPRPGQATTRTELTALFERRPLVFFEAPTGFGKTGVLLEFALGQLRSGHFDRALYLTSKSTGQLQVVRTLQMMTAEGPETEKGPRTRDQRPGTEDERPGTRDKGLGTSNPELRTQNPEPRTQNSAEPAATPVAAWHVRNKSEHCVNTVFHCVRDRCSYLADAASRWSQSGLARFYLDEKHARDLETLRAAGRDARICPYEITRAALAFNDVWIGDYNYVFAPRNRGLFFEQPGFEPARTLLLIDEAHNLPSRVADAYSHAFSAAEAFAVRDELHRIRPPAALVTAWDHWCQFLLQLRPKDALPLADEDDARHLLAELAKMITSVPLDLATLAPETSDRLWQVPSLVDDLAAPTLPRLWWCPRDGELALTCLDAAPAIGAALREFGGVVLASATLTPIDGFTAACGLNREENRIPDTENGNDPESERSGIRSPKSGISDLERLGTLNKRDTKKLFSQLTSAAELLKVEEARDAASPALLRAHTPWRDGAYDIAFDARVDTSFQHRSHHYTTTALTIAALQAEASGVIAVFFPSYAYADAIMQEMATAAAAVRVALQPRLRDLARQAAWVDESLVTANALFLVLGSSFAESIDVLGGRISHAMVVGPALPEVNAVQRARHADATRHGFSREAAFRRVYQIPGMTKVNQALGRLVRAPGQRARVVLHCRRFLDPSYTNLLASEYQEGTRIIDDDQLAAWLRRTVRA